MTPSKEGIAAGQKAIHDLWGLGFSTAKMATAVIEAYIAIDVAPLEQRVKELENKYRKALWLGHGCEGVYGDDGEMQCNDMILHGKSLDFKRMPLEELEEAVFIGKVKIYQRIWELEAELSPLRKRFEIVGELAAERGMENDELKEKVKELEAELKRIQEFPTVEGAKFTADMTMCLAALAKYDQKLAKTGLAALDGYNLLETLRRTELEAERDRMKQQYDTLAQSLKYDKERKTIVQKAQLEGRDG